MDYAQARRGMVDGQVRPHDVTDLRIIAALLEVPRERFLDPVHRSLAYLDAEVPVSAQSRRVLLKPMVFGKLLQAAGIDYESADVEFVPSLKVEVDADTARKVFRLIDALEDSDDVQNVYSNFDLSSEVQAELEDDE